MSCMDSQVMLHCVNGFVQISHNHHWFNYTISSLRDWSNVCYFKWHCEYSSEYIVECVFLQFTVWHSVHIKYAYVYVSRYASFLYILLVLYSNLKRTTAVLCGNYFKGLQNMMIMNHNISCLVLCEVTIIVQNLMNYIGPRHGSYWK